MSENIFVQFQHPVSKDWYKANVLTGMVVEHSKIQYLDAAVIDFDARETINYRTVPPDKIRQIIQLIGSIAWTTVAVLCMIHYILYK